MPTSRQSKPPAQRGYNTNLASEFYVMSVLYRLGLDANLTLGNKKAVDIVVARAAGDAVTIDVKGVAGKTDWIAGSVSNIEPRKRHFVVLLSYEGRLSDLETVPRAWILPHRAYLGVVKTASTGSMCYISRKQVRTEMRRFENAWHLIAGRELQQEAQAR